MKKKNIILLLLTLATITVTFGCSSKQEGAQSTISALKEVKNLHDADITIPAGIAGSELDDFAISYNDENTYVTSTESPVDEEPLPVTSTSAEASSDSINASLNADGSTTYSLTGAEREQIANGISSDITASIEVILADNDRYPNIESIIPNENGTEFAIYLKDGNYTYYESMLTFSFFTVGNKFQIYCGVPEQDVKTTVIYYNSTTNEVIAQADSVTSGMTY